VPNNEAVAAAEVVESARRRVSKGGLEFAGLGQFVQGVGLETGFFKPRRPKVASLRPLRDNADHAMHLSRLTGEPRAAPDGSRARRRWAWAVVLREHST